MSYDFKTIKYIPGLNFIRLIAVSFVLLSHYGFGKVFPGGFGVTVFFFLSGFLITTLLILERRRTGTISIANFYLRRFLRIGPELLFMLLISSLAWSLLKIGPDLGDLIAAITYTTNYYIIYLQAISTNGVGSVFWPQLWSLGVEEHYYLTFPLIFLLIASRWRPMLGFFAAAFILCLAWRYEVILSGLSAPIWEHAYGYLASETRFDSIAYGAFFAFLAQTNFKLSDNQGRLAFLIGMGMLAATFVIKGELFRETLRYTIQGVGLLLVFASIYRSDVLAAIPRVGEWKPFKIGGDLSYGAYLWQFEYVRLVEYMFPTSEPSGLLAKIGYAAGGFIFSFCLAWISYVWVAKPMLALRHRFGSKHK